MQPRSHPTVRRPLALPLRLLVWGLLAGLAGCRALDTEVDIAGLGAWEACEGAPDPWTPPFGSLTTAGEGALLRFQSSAGRLDRDDTLVVQLPRRAGLGAGIEVPLVAWQEAGPDDATATVSLQASCPGETGRAAMLVGTLRLTLWTTGQDGRVAGTVTGQLLDARQAGVVLAPAVEGRFDLPVRDWQPWQTFR